MRVRIFSLLFLLGFTLVIARLLYWQVYRARQLSIAAQGQYELGIEISAPRGNILALDGSWLAASGESWLVYAYLPDVKEPGLIADRLAPLFVDTSSTEDVDKSEVLAEAGRLKSLLTKSGVVWVPLKHKVSPEIKTNIEALALEGIGFEFEERRDYPEASSAAHLLGFVGKDSEGVDQGYFGLEGYYDLTLRGKPGFITREKDARGLPIVFGDSREISAIGGVDLGTHIDKTIQLTLDKKLLSGIEKYGATGGTVVVMNPADGAILGMRSYPSYDPATYFEFGDAFFKNPAVSEAFEPGSIFKVLIMAAALEAGEVTPDTKCEVCSGPLQVGKYYIETWNKVYHPDSTMLDVIVNSDNVGMAWVAQSLGGERLYEYLSRFGIGSLTGVDLQGEETPKLREKNSWSLVDVATAGFGQGVAVTPIQVVRAVSVIANRGVLVTPHVVERLIGDGWQEEISPEIRERVISEKTAGQVTAMMVEAAKNGEAKWTHLRGFNVAGKTGTAQIPISGHYDEEKTIASFVGFATASDPRFVMLVMLREPTSSPWASETAAPLWYDIAKDLFLYFGIQPRN